MNAVDLETLEAVHRFTQRWLTGGPVPVLGSPSWCALADDDPRKVTAAVRAGIGWWAGEVELGLPAWPDRFAAAVEARVAEELRALSCDLSDGEDWAEVAAGLRAARRADRARAGAGPDLERESA